MGIRKTKKRFDTLIFLFIIAITLGSYSSYSKYSASTTGNSSVNIASWKVSVNDDDITNGSPLTNNIGFKTISNPNVAQNKIAPSSKGYFDISIDTTVADVATHYTITPNLTADSKISQLGNIQIVGYEVLEEDYEPEDIPESPTLNELVEGSVEGDILLDSSTNKGRVENIRIYLKWIDDGSNQASAAGINQNIQIPIVITVEQFTN